jgi:hypothetical protein
MSHLHGPTLRAAIAHLRSHEFYEATDDNYGTSGVEAVEAACNGLLSLAAEAEAREDRSLAAFVRAASESKLGALIRWEVGSADLLLVLDTVYVSLYSDEFDFSGTYAIIRNSEGDELSEHHSPTALAQALDALAEGRT